MPKKLTSEEFIEKSKDVHGDRYDYSKVEYINSQKKVCIICKEHGEFWQTPNSHMANHGCSICAKISHIDKVSFNKFSFTLAAKAVHGDKYDYSKVEYINSKIKVCIICKEHGEFWQQPSMHLQSNGCPKCGMLKCLKKRFSNSKEFIKKSKLIHGDRYDYSNVNYSSISNKVCIVCPIHGEFWQVANTHLQGCGCKECGRIEKSKKLSCDTESFINKAKKIHGDKYDYSKVNYVNTINKVWIICPLHGGFEQRASTHLEGKGCPKCSHSISKAELNITNYLQSLDIEVINSDRTVLDGLELDIYIPSHNLAIEYDGLRWHSEEFGKDKYYHLNKTLQCKEKGIRLIHVFADEFLKHKDIVLNKIKHILGVSEELPKIMGRKCTIEVIDNDTAKSFLNANHIQGYGASTIHLGAVYGNELIAVMSFKKEDKECLKWELTRFASHNNYICQGVGGKLFKYFINTYNPQEVKSFADRRWTLDEENNLYTKLGFELNQILLPEYKYIVGNERKHKFGFRKQILNKKYDLPLTMTEKEMVDSLGIKKIWDCGLLKYVWKNKDSK